MFRNSTYIVSERITEESMLFARPSGEGVEVTASRKRKPLLARGPQERRILRDRVLVLLAGMGMTTAELLEVALAFANEPITSCMQVRRRIAAATADAERAAEGIGLLDSD